ncbi:MAG: hypothetical protein JST54_09460 [Deltaproteobacteria bacterium]|nr:hypothetical protein [Deltaproteobacteria bacterium]
MHRSLIAAATAVLIQTSATAFAQAPDAAATPAPAPAPAPATTTEVPPAAPAPAPQAAPAQPAVNIPAAHLNAGYGNGALFLRSDDDNFVFIPSGRFQYDFYAYQAAGHDKVPFDTFLPKRARIEAFGNIMKHWDYQLGAEFTNSTNPIATDIYVNANYTNYANVQLGQFDGPFTMENRTSDKWTDMQERSRVIAAFAYPENKEVGGMVWGQPNGKWAYWSAGLFNGEGLQNFKHTSNHFLFEGRGWIAPMGAMGNDLLKNVWVGGSYYNGFRNESPENPYYASTAAYTATFTNQITRSAMKDTAGLTFFNPVYGSIQAGDYGQRTEYAFEINAPVGPAVFKGEFVHNDEGLRELDYTNASKPTYVRTSALDGNGVYLRASYFFWGDKLINGLAGMQVPPRMYGDLKPAKTADALQLVVNWDHMNFDYLADNDPNNKDPLAGHYDVSIYGVGLNYWYTKHIRLTTNFLYDVFSGSAYQAPGATTFKNTPLAPFSGTAYEFTFRAALAI